MSEIRVRIAPSPTGIPHIGNTRTALFNFLFAKHYNGKFILRIEDTDRARYVPQAEKAIEEILTWLDLGWDEKYIQSERLDIYREHVEKLLKKGVAYKDEGAIRFKIPADREIVWEDAIGNKKISFKTDVIEDFVILKSDGFPTYHLANVVDDSLMKISHVIRGDEWISSTPKHIFLYEAFGLNPPIFAHLPVILGPDKAKLSKRHGAKSALDYRNEGYLKEALLNFMALLGWNPGQNREILSLEEMIKFFDLKDVNTAGPVFDLKKLTWMNGIYIRQLKTDELKAKLKRPASQRGEQNSKVAEIDDGVLDKLVLLAKSRMTTLNDFYELAKPFFEEPEIVLDENEKKTARILSESLLKTKKWTTAEILEVLKKVSKETGQRMTIFYKIITGQTTGLPLPESLEIFGRKKTLERLSKLIK